MTKEEAINIAKQRLAESGETQYVMRRGDEYKPFLASDHQSRGWRIVEFIAIGNAHNY